MLYRKVDEENKPTQIVLCVKKKEIWLEKKELGKKEDFHLSTMLQAYKL